MPTQDERLKSRNLDIWHDYLHGHPQRVIADKFGIDQTTVSKVIISIRDKTPQDDRDELRRLDLDRLDAMLPRNLAAAIAGDPAAVKNVLAIMDRRAKYLGLDAATKQEVSAGVRYEIAGLPDSNDQ